MKKKEEENLIDIAEEYIRCLKSLRKFMINYLVFAVLMGGVLVAFMAQNIVDIKIALAFEIGLFTPILMFPRLDDWKKKERRKEV